MNTTQFAQKILENSQAWKYKRKMINWNQFRWITQENWRSFTFTLQKNGTNYILTIQATNPNEVIIQLHSWIIPDVKKTLQQLFQSAASISIEAAKSSLWWLL